MKNLFQHLKSTYSGLPRDAWLLSMVMLINRIGMVVVFYLTLYLTQMKNYSVADAGKLVGIYGAGSLVGSYLGGWLSDHWGTAKIQFLSLSLSGFGYFSFLFLSSFWQLAIALFLLAVVAESIRPANIAAIADVCPVELRPRGFALNRLAVNAGIAIGPAIGGYLARINYDYLFWMDGITSLAAAFLFVLVFRNSHFGKPIKNIEKQSPLAPLKDTSFTLALSLLLIVSIFFLQIFNTWPLYLNEHYNLLESEIGFLLAGNAILLVLFEMPIIHRLEKIPPLKIIPLGVLFLFWGFAVLPFGVTFLFAAFSTIIWTVGEMLIFPLFSTFIANRSNEGNRGKYMGLMTFTTSVAFIIGPITGARIYENWSPEILWYITGVVGIFVSLGFRKLMRFTNRQT